jgi:signal transduction histidine kinase
MKTDGHKKIFTADRMFLMFMAANVVVIIATLASRFTIGIAMGEMEHDFELRLVAAAKSGASLVAAAELDGYRDIADMNTPPYLALKENLRGFAEDAEVKYAYYLRVLDGKMQYIVDNDFDEKTKVGLGTLPIDAGKVPGLASALEGRVSSSGLGNYMPGWPGLMSAYAPVFDAEGRVAAVCGVDINDAIIVSARRASGMLWLMEVASIVTVALTGMFSLAGYNHEARLARSASAAKTQFLSKVSHEMRTPLAVMSANAQLSDALLRSGGSLPKIYAALGVVRKEASRLARMSDTMIALEAASGEFSEMSGVDAARLIRNIADIYRTLAEHSGNRLTADIPDDMPRVMGNADGISQVLINLISNSNAHTKGGEIRVSMSRGDGAVTVAVSDNGEGVPPEAVSEVFKRRPRLRKDGVPGGIGLSICKEIIDLHGGRIWMESGQGVGTTVCFTLPAEGSVNER